MDAEIYYAMQLESTKMEQLAKDKPNIGPTTKFTSWFADITSCASCKHDHRGVRVIVNALGDLFICPETESQVSLADERTEAVSIASTTSGDGLSPEERARTRAFHYRSDVNLVSGVDDARATDGELSIADIRSARDRINARPVPSAESSAENSYQIGGTHYGLRPIQHWDIVAMFDLDYFQGQITKYIMRWRDKNGVEDLEKAAHYLEKYIAIEKENEVESARLDAEIKARDDDTPNNRYSCDNCEYEPTESERRNRQNWIRCTACGKGRFRWTKAANTDPVDPQEGAS